MKDSKQLHNLQYHQARKSVHLNRPDGIKVSLNALGFTYTEKSSLLMSHQKQKTPDNTSIVASRSQTDCKF